MPDGGRLLIGGEFLAFEPPHRLEFSSVVGKDGPVERVAVSFHPVSVGEGAPVETRVRVHHTRIADEATHRSHRAGWEGCLDGLAAWVGTDA